jgi:acyl carrier protein
MRQEITNPRIRHTVFGVLDELNEQLPADQRLAKADTTVLVGPDGVLDSLGLVNLIAMLEQRLERDFHVSVSLIEDDLMTESATHFGDVASLTRYLASVLEPHVDG